MRAANARHVGRHGGLPRPAGAWPRPAGRGASAAAVPLIVLASVPGVGQPAQGFPGDAWRAGLVSVANRLIEQARPGQQIALSVVAADKPDRYRLTLGLVWALTGDGYRLERRSHRMHTQPVPNVTVRLRSGRITVAVTDPATGQSRA